MKKVDSSEAYFASAKCVDRHALQSKARDDRKKADSRDCHDFASAKSRNDRNLFFQQDSRHCGTPKEVENVFSKKASRILGFLMDFARCAVASKEIRLCAYRRSETQTRAKGAKRQNPKPNKGD